MRGRCLERGKGWRKETNGWRRRDHFSEQYKVVFGGGGNLSIALEGRMDISEFVGRLEGRLVYVTHWYVQVGMILTSVNGC